MTEDLTNQIAETRKTADLILENEVVERHSIFQLQCFVLGKEFTIQGKLHQCLLEIKSRKLSLDSLQLELEEQNDKLQFVQLDIEDIKEKETEGRDILRKEIQLRSMERQKKSIENNIKELNTKQKHISEELQFFCSAFDQLSRQEKVKPWDDPDVQSQYWTEKLRFEINTRLLLRQLPDTELTKTVLCLHDDSPIKKSLVDILKKVNEQAAISQKQDIITK